MYKSFCIFLSCLIAVSAFAVNPVMNFKEYNTTDGLSSDIVTSVLQDHMGYVWVGTSSGLDRFDGKRFFHYELPPVTTMVEDEGHNLWIGTSSGLYFMLHTVGTISRLESETDFGVVISSSVNDLEIDADGNIIWIATEGQGVMCYDKNSGTLTQYSKNISITTDIQRMADGSLLFCAEGSNIFIFRDGTVTPLFSLDVNKEQSRELRINGAFVRNGKVYIAPEHEPLICHDMDEDMLGNVSDVCQITGVTSMIDFSKNISLVASSDGLFLCNLDTGWNCPVVSRKSDHVFSHHVTCLYKDREDGIWVGTYGRGVFYIPKNNKEVHFRSSPLPADKGMSLAVTCFATDAENNLLVGTKEGYLWRVSADGTFKLLTSDLPNIQCLLCVRNRILVGTYSDGLYVIDKGGAANYRYDRFDEKSIVANNVRTIWQSRDGIIWVGTEWGLCTFNMKTGEFDLISGDAGKLNITDIIEDNKSRLWVSTANGRIIMTGPYRRLWRVYNIMGSDLSSGVVTCLYEDSQKNIIAGTDHGLFKFDEESNRFIRHDGECSGDIGNRPVCALQEDAGGTLWVSCNSCIFGLSGGGKQSCIILYKDVGECVLLQDSSIRLDNGTICFGGTNGYYYFNPQDLRYDTKPADVLMSQVLVNASPVDITAVSAGKPLRLKRNRNNISFEFALLNFSAPEKNRYYYMLEGQDQDWIFSGNDASVKYDNLPSGRYVFRVRAYNNDGIPARAGLEFPLVIRKPWYATWCAVLCYILILVVIYVVVVDVMRKKRARLKSESTIRAYNNFARDVRDSVTLITVPLRHLLNDSNVSSSVREYLQSMERTSEHLLNTIDYLLYFNRNNQVGKEKNLVETDIVTLIDDIVVKFGPLADARGISIRKSETHSGALACSVDVKMIQSICGTILSNALKYAETFVSVELTDSDDSFTLIVTNDVSGISIAEREKMFGVSGTRGGDSKTGLGPGLTVAHQFTENHGGYLDVSCEDDRTVFRLHFPVSLESLEDTSEISDSRENTILYMDENVEMRKMVTKLLSRHYKVVSASSGESGMNILNDVAVSLIICDVKLSDMSGYDFCYMIKNDARMSDIPLIFLTSKIDIEDKLRGYDVGSDDYMEKPFEPELLKARIKNLLLKRNQLRDFYTSSGVCSVVRADMTIAHREFLNKLTSIILDRMSDEDFYVDDLAAAMYMSKSSLYRKVKSLLGISPIDYIKQARLHKSAEMLSSGEYDVCDVWQKVGFSSLAYFATCFKKQFGTTPSRYLAERKECTTGE